MINIEVYFSDKYIIKDIERERERERENESEKGVLSQFEE